MTPPAANSTPRGSLSVRVGEPVEFTVCGESFVGGDIEIVSVDAPGWCDRVSRGDGCETFVATPDAPGVYALRFRIVDDENDTATEHSVTIEAAPRGGPCNNPPLCGFDPAGPISMVAGETEMIEFCWETGCEGNAAVLVNPLLPGFCMRTDPAPMPDGSFCVTVTCSPGLVDVGMHTIEMMVEDLTTSMTTTCTISVEVTAPPECADPPSCAFSPMGPVQIELGESEQIEFCWAPACDLSSAVIINPNLPSFCQLSMAMSQPDGSTCVTVSCTPSAGDLGLHTIEITAEDLLNSRTTTCTVDVLVLVEGGSAPPECSFMPASGMIEIEGGGNDQYQICVKGFSGEVEFVTNNAPSWCFDTGASGDVFVGKGEGCATADCHPPLDAVGQTFTVDYLVTDLITGATSECSFDIKVIAPPPPACSFMPPDQIVIPAGGNDQYQICVEAFRGSVEFVTNNAPSWCFDAGASGGVFNDAGGGCAFTDCHPPFSAAGQTFTVDYLVTDLETGATSECSFDIVVPELEPPTCEISEQVIAVYPGESATFELCASAQNGEDELFFNPSNMAPAFLSPLNGTFFGEGCETLTFAPVMNATPSTHVQVFNITDVDSGLVTQCEITLIVLCPDEPTCEFTEDGPVEVEVGEPIDFEFCGYPGCDTSFIRIEMIGRPPFIDPAGHQKGGRGETLCLPIKGAAGPQHAGNTYPVRVRITNLSTGQVTDCDIRIRVLGGGDCSEPPLCSIDPGEMIHTSPGLSASYTVCAEPSCPTGKVMIEAGEMPDFCGPIDPVRGGVGEQACLEFECEVPSDAPDGEYPFSFRITDLTSGAVTICNGAIVVGPPAGCVEVEPNDDPALCTLLDAEGCLNIDCGAFISGALDDSGSDVDVYYVEGLSPDTEYTIRIVGGLGSDMTLTCAVAVCLDSAGERIGAGSTAGVQCVADAGGAITFGVTGCGDADLDGARDDESSGIAGHGEIGGYVVLIGRLTPDAATVACHADMNGDGMVDAADLGMLIGVFGEVCAPE